MGNVFSLFRSWMHRSDDHTKELTVSYSNSSREPRVYSWDKKSNVGFSHFQIYRIIDQENHRALTEQGQQLKIESCMRSLITVLGYTDSVYIDDCAHCKIILGPTRGSVFLRNCNHCIVLSACGQFRTRDCVDVICFLFCASQPSIEATTAFRLQCLSLNYPGFNDHLTQVGFNRAKVNRWSEVFDFSKSSFSNWEILPVDSLFEEFLTQKEVAHCNNHQVAFERTTSIIPFTHPKLNISNKMGTLNVSSLDISNQFYSVVNATTL